MKRGVVRRCMRRDQRHSVVERQRARRGLHDHGHRRLQADRPTDRKDFFLHGVVLVGVRSTLGIDSPTGSPFNVQRSVHVPNLTRDEVRAMFAWYERESGQRWSRRRATLANSDCRN